MDKSKGLEIEEGFKKRELKQTIKTQTEQNQLTLNIQVKRSSNWNLGLIIYSLAFVSSSIFILNIVNSQLLTETFIPSSSGHILIGTIPINSRCRAVE